MSASMSIAPRALLRPDTANKCSSPRTTRDLVYQDLPPGVSLRELGAHLLKDIRYPQTIYQLEIQGLQAEFPALRTLATAEEPPTPGQPPYKGLQFFDEGDSDWFFGREEVSAKLAGYVRDHRFLAIIGASGSGKSSVVRAGLVPALKRSQGVAAGGSASTMPWRWRIHIMTPTTHPLEALATCLTRDSQSVTTTATLMDDLAKDKRSLHLYVRRALKSAQIAC